MPQPRISHNKAKIIHNLRRSRLKLLRKLERGDISFSKTVMAKLAPWTPRMCYVANVEFPATFEALERVETKRLIRAAFSSQIFLDI